MCLTIRRTFSYNPLLVRLVSFFSTHLIIIIRFVTRLVIYFLMRLGASRSTQRTPLKIYFFILSFLSSSPLFHIATPRLYAVDYPFQLPQPRLSNAVFTGDRVIRHNEIFTDWFKNQVFNL